MREEHGRKEELIEESVEVERQRVEEAMQESEERYRTLFERVPIGLYRTTPEGQIVDANPALVEMLGYPDRQALMRVNVSDLYVDPKERLQEQALLERQGVVGDFEAQLRRCDGRVIWVKDTVQAVRKGKGEVVYYEGALEDITHRKRAERLLQGLNEVALAMQRALTPEEVFSAVVEEFRRLGFSCAVLLTDEGQSRLFPKYFSYESKVIQAAEKLVGLEAEDFSIPVETVDVYRNVIRERKAVFVDNAEEVVRQLLPGPARRFGRRIAKMLGVSKSKSIDAPLIVEDQVRGVLLVQSDDLTEEDLPAITAFAHQMAAAWHKDQLMQELRKGMEELRETQAQLLQAQKMEAIGRLAGGVAHDFNNLLTAIMGYSQLLRGELPPDDPRRLDVEQILKASGQATSLTRQLLAFSRRDMFQRQVVDLNGLVAEAEKMLRRLIGEDIELITILDSTSAQVKADPGQMEQVIMNLVVNARDAMPQGGRLTIKTEDVTLEARECVLIPKARPGSFVRLSVADTGVGMDEQILQRIFEPFFTTKEGGTGLGLSVVYGIVTRHEGWINVYSEPGQGSTFKVYLPAFSLKPEVETEEVVSLQGLQGRGEGILLVEDDEGVRKWATRGLGEKGYLVFEAANVKGALDIFERERGNIHLLFSDVVLSDGTGLQLVEQLLRRKGDLQVLLSSGYSDDKSQWSVVRERGFRFVEKPYTLPQLLAAIREVIEQGD